MDVHILEVKEERESNRTTFSWTAWEFLEKHKLFLRDEPQADHVPGQRIIWHDRKEIESTTHMSSPTKRTSECSGKSAIRRVAFICSTFWLTKDRRCRLNWSIRLIVSLWYTSLWLKADARAEYVMSFVQSVTREDRKEKQHTVPSWVGPIPPLVITKSCFFTSLWAASELKGIWLSQKRAPDKFDVHLFFQVWDDFYPLSTIRALDLSVKIHVWHKTQAYKSIPCSKQYCAKQFELRSNVFPFRISSLMMLGVVIFTKSRTHPIMRAAAVRMWLPSPSGFGGREEMENLANVRM